MAWIDRVKKKEKFKYIEEYQVSGVKMDFLVNGTTTFSHW